MQRSVTEVKGSVADAPHALQGDGFSVHPRRQPRESPQALTAPVNGSCRIQIAVQHEAAGLFAQAGVFAPGSTNAVGHQDIWLRRTPPASPPQRQGSSPMACGGRKPDSVILGYRLEHPQGEMIY